MYPTIQKKLLQQAVSQLLDGELVAIPTETVYGLAVDASNPDAVNKIFQVKQRPIDHPLILHIANIDQLSYWAKTIPPYAQQLAQQFWPGPMTLILPKQDHVLSSITGGQDTVGLRVPQHPIAQKILQALGPNKALAAPSANRFGHISPTLAEHVQQDLGEQVKLIIDGGSCNIGIESTIIDCTTATPKILRPGMISAAMIEQAINKPFIKSKLKSHSNSDTVLTNTQQPIPRVSGALKSHYAPETTTQLISETELTDYCAELTNYVVLARSKPTIRQMKLYDARLPTRFRPISAESKKNWLLMPNDAQAYAHVLYEQLHFADQLNCQLIIIEDVPSDQDNWLGIRDRLVKASH